jgi:cell division septum initiation protein DivIVA
MLSSFGGRELKEKATQEVSHIADQAKAAAHKVEGKAKEVANKVTSS